MEIFGKSIKRYLIRFLTLVTLTAFLILKDKTNRIRLYKDSPSDAYNALQFFSAQRSYPEKDIPNDVYYKSYEISKSLIKKSSNFLNPTDVWESIGPVNQGGRTNALAIDPNNPDIIYAGSASGGLWRSTTGGVGINAWEYIDTGYPVLGVNAIAIDPLNSDVIYIGTGEVYGYQNSDGGLCIRTTRGSYGIGLLKTTDGGSTWEKSIDWSYNQKRGILDIEINPMNSSIIFAGTTEGVYKSEDAGENWEKVHDVLMAVDVDINPIDTNIVYVSCGNLDSPSSGIYRSKNSGNTRTWTKLSGGLPKSWSGKTLLDIYKSSPEYIFADVADAFETIGLYKSTDYGETWELLNEENYAKYQGWFSHYVRVNPVDSSDVFCAGVFFFTSDDGGETIERKFGTHVDHHCFANHPDNPDIVYFGNDGGVYRTTNGGDTFEDCNDGYITSQFYPGFSSSNVDSDFAIGGLQDNNTIMYTGSKRWKTNLIGGDGTYTAINPEDNDIIYGSKQYLRIYKSENKGKTWSWINESNNYGSNVSFVAPFIISPSNPDILYAGASNLWRSINSGKDWKVRNEKNIFNSNPLLSVAVSPVNPNILYVSTAPVYNRARLFSSYNGGKSWDDITGNLPDRYYVDIAVSPDDYKKVYVTLSGFGSSHLYRSDNGGNTWIDIGQGLPDVPTSAVVLDPENPNHIYVGNDIGVYVSTDDGVNWYEFSEGLHSAVLVMDLSISSVNRKIRAVTHGNGVFERSLLSIINGTNDDSKKTVTDYRLYQNYPNPFNFVTTIKYYLPKTSKVTIDIFNIQGKYIETLVDKIQSSGAKYAIWDASDYSSGVYFCRLRANTYEETVKMTFIK